LIKNDEWADAIYKALEQQQPELVFEGKELALLRYTRTLTVDVGNMSEAEVQAARDAGADDGEILEVNQVCAYFNYSNRLLNGLGVTMDGDTVGYYQEDNPLD
jgi:alkylhydroperoxidase family enzyme